MAGLFDKVVGFFTFRDEYIPETEDYDEEEYEEEVFDEEYEDDSEDYDYDEDVPTMRVITREEQEEEVSAVLVEKPLRSECKHVDYTPFSFDDMAHVVDVLNAGKAVVLYLAELDDSFRQRVIDFTCGVVYSLKCICDMPTDDVCILIPNNVEAFGV